jgi:hypothetical protein
MENPAESTPVPEVIDNDAKVNVEVKEKKRHRNPIFWPFILIVVGIILLAQNLVPNLPPMNWWAVFIFIPVVGSLSAAWAAYRRSGTFNSGVRGSLGSALVIGTVAFMFLLGVNWSRY